MMWLRSYISYHNLALIFNVSVDTVHNEINRCIPIIKRALKQLLQWPTINEYREKRCSWTKVESAVGVIDSVLTDFVCFMLMSFAFPFGSLFGVR